MKKTLKISGIIGLSAIVLSSIMKIMHWPGAGPLLTLGFVALLLAYLPALSLTLKKEKILKRNRNLSYVGIFAAFFLFLSVLFGLQHWPYSDYLKYLSWIFMLLFLVLLFKNIMKTEENRVLNLSMLLFFSILFIFDVTFSFLDLKNPRLSKFTLESNIEASINLFEQRTEKTYEALSATKDTLHASEIAELKTKTADIIGKIEYIRNSIFASKAEQEEFSKRFIKSAGDIEKDQRKFESDIKAYQQFILTKTASQPELKTFIESNILFGRFEFNNNPPVVYNNLQKLIRDIKIAESEILTMYK